MPNRLREDSSATAMRNRVSKDRSGNPRRYTQSSLVGPCPSKADERIRESRCGICISEFPQVFQADRTTFQTTAKCSPQSRVAVPHRRRQSLPGMARRKRKSLYDMLRYWNMSSNVRGEGLRIPPPAAVRSIPTDQGDKNACSRGCRDVLGCHFHRGGTRLRTNAGAIAALPGVVAIRKRRHHAAGCVRSPACGFRMRSNHRRHTKGRPGGIRHHRPQCSPPSEDEGNGAWLNTTPTERQASWKIGDKPLRNGNPSGRYP